VRNLQSAQELPFLHRLPAPDADPLQSPADGEAEQRRLLRAQTAEDRDPAAEARGLGFGGPNPKPRAHGRAAISHSAKAEAVRRENVRVLPRSEPAAETVNEAKL
jgi:hypothetical protein